MSVTTDAVQVMGGYGYMKEYPRIPHCLLLEIFTNKGIGTAIIGEAESRYYHEKQ